MAFQNTPEVRKLAKDYIIGKQFKAKFFGSLTIGDAKEDAADSFKFIRASDLTSGSKQPTVIITLKLKGISVFAAGSTKFAILEMPIQRVIYVCHDPDDVTAFGVVIKTQDRGLRLHAFQSDETTAISFVHSSQELFQLALKIVKAKQKLYEHEQQTAVGQSDPPPPYASVVSETYLRATTMTTTKSTSEERATTANVIRRKKTSVEGTCAVPRPARRSSMILTPAVSTLQTTLLKCMKEAPKLFRRATIYSVVDQQNEAGREDNIQTMSVQDPHSGLGGASSLFSPPRNAMSSPASVSLTSSDARYAKIDVAGALSPSQAGFLPQWQSSPLTQNTYQSPIGQNQSPLHAGLRGLDVSQTSLSLQNPLYSSSSLIPSPQNVHYVAEPFPFASFPSNQLPTLNPNQTSNQSTNQASLQTAGGQKVSTTFTDSLVSAQLKTGGARIRRNTSMSAKEMSSMGAVNTSPHAGGSLEKCVPLDSGRQSHSASLKNTFEDSFHQPSSYEDTQARTPSQASFKGDLPIQSGPHNTHAPASPFEDDFLPIFQANRNEPNAPANATTNSTPSAMTHMFEDSFTSPPVHFLTGDSFQTSQSFENSFQSSLTFNPFDDNFYTLVSQNIEQQPTFVNDSSTSSNLHINPQPFVGFEDHFVQ